MKIDAGAISMETEQRPRRTPPAWRQQPIGEVYRRLVGIHAALAERTNSDPEVRPFAVRELMDVLRYIEHHGDQPTSTGTNGG
jgi:hypothetical protein